MGFEHFWLSGFDQLHAAFWTYLVVGLQNGAVYAMIAVGYTLVYGVLGLINFAHGEVFMCGGFAGVLLSRGILGSRVATGWASVGLILAGIIIGGLISSLVAMGVERVAYRPLRQRNAPKLAYLISAIGASYFIQTFAGKEFGYGVNIFPAAVFEPGKIMFTFLGTPVHTIAVVSIIAAIVMLVAADRIVRATRLGRGIRAVSQDAETSSLMGVNIDRTITITFILGGVLAGAAGFLYSLQSGIVQNAGTEIGIYAFTAAVLGGIGNLRGAALGGLFIGLFGSFSVPFAFEGNVQWTEIYTFLILVLVLIIRPTGILGEKVGANGMSFFNFTSLKRLSLVLIATGVIAMMTGTAGSSTAPPTTGIHGSFLEKVSYFGLFKTGRWAIFLTLGVLVWLISSWYIERSHEIRQRVNRVLVVPKRLTAKRSTRLIIMGIALVVVLVLPKIETQPFWMYLIVEQIGVWILLALGLNVVVGFAGLLDLGFAAFYAIGAYTTAWLTGALPMPALFHHPIPTLWVIPIGIVAAMIFGVLLGTPTLRLRGDYLAIVTLGFALIIDDFVEIQSGVTGGGVGSTPVPHPSLNLGFVHIHWGLSPTPYYYLCLLFVVIFIIIFTSLEHSRVGRAWVAIREDEVAAESVGINPLKYKVMAFAVGAASGGFGGVLSAGLVGIIAPGLFTYQISVNVLVLVIFGGMGSIWGVAIGAIVLQTATSYLDNYQPWGYQINDLYMYIGALLIIMMIFRPAGLLPSRRRAREFAAAEQGEESHLDEVLTGEQP